MMSSGYLPLMMPMLLSVCLCEGLVARVAWADGCLKAKYVQNIAAPALQLIRVLSLMLHLGSVVGDLRVLASAGAYILAFVMTKGTMCARPAAGEGSRIS